MIPPPFYVFSIIIICIHIITLHPNLVNLARAHLITKTRFDSTRIIRLQGVILRSRISSRNLRLPRGKHHPILLMTRIRLQLILLNYNRQWIGSPHLTCYFYFYFIPLSLFMLKHLSLSPPYYYLYFIAIICIYIIILKVRLCAVSLPASSTLRGTSKMQRVLRSSRRHYCTHNPHNSTLDHMTRSRDADCRGLGDQNS